jgi:hypothetical protein
MSAIVGAAEFAERRERDNQDFKDGRAMNTLAGSDRQHHYWHEDLAVCAFEVFGSFLDSRD